jgi:hypothetical protein
MIHENIQTRHAFGTWAEFGFDTKPAIVLEMFDLIKNDAEKEELLELFKAGVELEELGRKAEETDKKKASRYYIRAVDDFITTSIKYVGGGKRGAAMIPIAAGVGAITMAAVTSLVGYIATRKLADAEIDEINEAGASNGTPPQDYLTKKQVFKSSINHPLANSLRLGGTLIGAAAGNSVGKSIFNQKVRKDIIELATHLRHCIYKVRELRVPEDLERLNRLIRENVNTQYLSSIASDVSSSAKSDAGTRRDTVTNVGLTLGGNVLTNIPG